MFLGNSRTSRRVMLSIKRCETSNSLYGGLRRLPDPYDPVRPQRAAVIRSSYRASKSALSSNPTDGRRHGAHIDDEGGRVPPDKIDQPAQNREQVFAR